MDRPYQKWSERRARSVLQAGWLPSCVVAMLLLAGCGGAGDASSSGGATTSAVYSNFESPQTNPLRLSPDGTRLFVVNTAAGRLSVFSLLDPLVPVLIAEVPVGLEPVSVWPSSNDEAWVVNNLSDSVSVVSVSRGIVTATLPAGDEPSDVLMAGTPLRVFVSSSRSGEIQIFDPASKTQTGVIPLRGEHPRALAVSADGARLYVAFALSGNGTTIVPPRSTPPPPPEPSIPGLPLAPPVGRIVDAADPDWSYAIPFTLLDHDVAEIDVASQSLTRYYDKVGTVNLGLTVQPGTGDLFIANTDARNLVSFETSLRGHLVDNRITRLSPGSAPSIVHFDLNPGVDYGLLPNLAALATALSQPTSLQFDPSGDFLWVAAFGTDRVAKVDSSGIVQSIVEIGGIAGVAIDPPHKRGPRALAISANGAILYVQNRISNTISVIDAAGPGVVREIPAGSFDSTPAFIREGRELFYDARLSGNGNASCASCHVDGDTDNLAWNLGNPQGSMVSVLDPVSGLLRSLHPMKGPMVTQPLAGIGRKAPFHWRGDMPTLNAFNRAFDKLMGGAEIAADRMQVLSDFMAAVTAHPNPNLQLDRSFRAFINGQSPAAGLEDFKALVPSRGPMPCTGCHTLPGQPFQARIVEPPTGNMAKVPEPVLAYRKVGYQNAPGAFSTLGFGLTQDGSGALDLSTSLTSFVLSWDTGTAPAVGYSVTVDSTNALVPSMRADWLVLEERARRGDNGIVVQGVVNGERVSLMYSVGDGAYHSCAPASAPSSRPRLWALAEEGRAVFTVMGIPPASWRCHEGQAWP